MFKGAYNCKTSLFFSPKAGGSKPDAKSGSKVDFQTIWSISICLLFFEFQFPLCNHRLYSDHAIAAAYYDEGTSLYD